MLGFEYLATIYKKVTDMSLEFIKGAWRNRDTTLWLIFLRLIIGIEWFMAGIIKLINPTYVADMAGTLGYFASGNTHAWYVNLINNTFIPNSEVFAWLVSLGELIIGVTLIFGIFVNFSAIASIFLNLNFYFAAAWISASTQSVNWIMMTLGFIILLSPGVKSLSVDLFVSEKIPKLRRFLIDWFSFEKKSNS